MNAWWPDEKWRRIRAEDPLRLHASPSSPSSAVGRRRVLRGAASEAGGRRRGCARPAAGPGGRRERRRTATRTSRTGTTTAKWAYVGYYFQTRKVFTALIAVTAATRLTSSPPLFSINLPMLISQPPPICYTRSRHTLRTGRPTTPSVPPTVPSVHTASRRPNMWSIRFHCHGPPPLQPQGPTSPGRQCHEHKHVISP